MSMILKSHHHSTLRLVHSLHDYLPSLSYVNVYHAMLTLLTWRSQQQQISPKWYSSTVGH